MEKPIIIIEANKFASISHVCNSYVDHAQLVDDAELFDERRTEVEWGRCGTNVVLAVHFNGHLHTLHCCTHMHTLAYTLLAAFDHMITLAIRVISVRFLRL
jgi:hypothetical protein